MAVPELRFKEFTSDWSLKRIEEFSSKIGSGSTPLGGERAYIDNGIPFIRSQNVANNELNLDGIKFISESLNSKMSGTIVKKYDLLLNITGASIGRSCVVPNSFNIGNVNQHVCIIRLKDEHNPYFYQPYLASDRGQKMIMSTQVGGGREGLNFQAIRAFEIHAPGIDEQTKIANFLTAVDAKISQLTKKYELLTLYKKGVMQKIFNQELRFKDDEGREFPEWSQVSFADIANINMGQSPDSSTYNQDSLGLPLIQGNADIVNRKTSPRAWTSEPTKKCNPGDLILTVRAPVGAIAKSSHAACIGRGVCAITAKENVSIEFLYQLLFWFESYKWKAIEQGSTFTAVSGEDIRNLIVMSPAFKEQTKIANFLTAIDDKITNVKSQLEAAKEYKQGLLQQMFV